MRSTERHACPSCLSALLKHIGDSYYYDHWEDHFECRCCGYRFTDGEAAIISSNYDFDSGCDTEPPLWQEAW